MLRLRARLAELRDGLEGAAGLLWAVVLRASGWRRHDPYKAAFKWEDE